MKKQIRQKIERQRYKSPLVLFIMFTIIIILFISIFTGNVSSMEEDMQHIEVRYIYVREGDTLWELCREHYPESNIRKKIHDIKNFNDIKGDYLIEGEILIFPEN